MIRRGFTLIELLVVIAIILVLMGVAMPLLGIANRVSKQTATRSVMVKVDTALRLFRADFGPYPWQASYADLTAGEAWTNRLYWHIGTDMTSDERDKLFKDADMAARDYEVFTPTISDNAFIDWDFWGAASTDGRRWNRSGGAKQLNRMAAERARLAIYAGNVKISGPVLPIPWIQWNDMWTLNHVVRRVKPTTPLLATPTAAKAGMAKDYLRGELEKRYIDGETIIDGWKRPLLYVCQVIEGMTTQPMMSGDGVTLLSAVEWGMQPTGRKTLAQKDTYTALPLTADPLLLPDLANMRHSDRRYYAPKGLEVEFELWSAGPDGRADWMRDAAANNDNIPLQPYDKNIP